MTRKIQLRLSLFIATVIAVACSDPPAPKPHEQAALGGTASTLVGGGRAGQTGHGGTSSTNGDEPQPSYGGDSSEPETTGGAPSNSGGRSAMPDTQFTGGKAAHSVGNNAAGNLAVTGGVGGTPPADDEPFAGANNNETGGTSNMPAERVHPYFSEYLENGSYKALEIAAAQAGSLTDCGIRVHANGGKTLLRSIALNETITPDAPLVLCSQELANISPRCQRVENLRFNGNDVIELACAGIVYDVFGQLGDTVDPAWGNGDYSTAGHDLRRNCEITSGEPNADDPFDPSAEWQSFAPTELSGLGARCTPAEPTIAGAGGAAGDANSNGGAAGSN